MAADITKLTEGWLELESDPGLFTLLLHDFGVDGVQVEEIYDTDKPIQGPIYGFVFLFRWIEERRSRRKFLEDSEPFQRDESIVNNIFFAQQMVPNSCATHALVSILLNCHNINLGSTLKRLKDLTEGMNPENKGWAIGNTPELARAHNFYATRINKPKAENKSVLLGLPTRASGETFHFVSYVPINGRLYELDGLKQFPIDHGPIDPNVEWSEHFRRFIRERLGTNNSGEPNHDIRSSLLAVVPDKKNTLISKLRLLKTNQKVILADLDKKIEERKKRVVLGLTNISDPFSLSSSSDYSFTNISQDIEDLVSQITNTELDYSAQDETEYYEDAKDEKERQWLIKYANIYENRKYAPKDLLTILKNLDNDIALLQPMLVDELEKRKKYTIDGKRRIHDYDVFIDTFLAMLAEQGQIGALLEPQLMTQKIIASSGGKPSSMRQSTGAAETQAPKKRHGNLGRCRKKK